MADLSKIKLNGTTYNFKDSEARPFIVRITSENFIDESYEYYPTDKTYEETLTALNNGKHVVLIGYDNSYLGSATKSAGSNIYFTRNSFTKNKTHTQLSINWYEFNSSGVRSSRYDSSTGTGTPFENSFYTTNTLPRLVGSKDQILVSDGTRTLKWQDQSPIPTKLTDLTNDAGFISAETDPTVPEWAKQSTKPTYTASEVGALPDTYVPPEEVMVVTFTKVNETSYTADKTFDEVLAAKYAVARALNNSSTYWWYVPTSASSGAMAFSRQQGGKHSSFTWMKSSGNITYSSQDLERQSLKVTEITSSSTNNQYPSAKATYDFVNNAVAGISCISDSQVNGTSIVSNGVANLVTETAYNSSTNKIATMSDIDDAVSSVEPIVVTVTEDPDTGVVSFDKTYEEIDTAIQAGTNVIVVDSDTGSIYPYQGKSVTWCDRLTAYNFYTIEYNSNSWNINGYYIAAGTASWAKGRISDSISMDDYLQGTDIADWAKAANKPTYTAMEVGALPNTYTAPVTSVNGATGTPKTSFYVTITGDSATGYTADKTFDQVAAAYEAGYAVYAINGLSILSLSMVRYSEEQISNISFSRTGGSQIYTFIWAKNSNSIVYSSVNISNYVPTSRTINNKALTSDMTLTASDVGALPDTYTAPVTSVNGQTGVVSLTIPSAVTNSYSVDSNSGKVMLYTSTNSSSTVTQTKTSGALDFSISGGGDATLQIGKSSTDEGTRGLIKISNHANANYTTIDAPAWAATEIHLPSSSGTLALTSEIPSVSVTDVQINGTSIISNDVANIVTNTAYNASSNKIATMSDVPEDKLFLVTATMSGLTTGTSDKSVTEIAAAVAAGKFVYIKTTVGATTITAPLMHVVDTVDVSKAVFNYDDQQNSNQLYHAVLEITGTTVTVTWTNEKYARESQIPDSTSDLTNDSGFITAATAPVSSVNTKTGAIVLTAADVGALPSDTAIPSKVSDLNNDTGFITSAALPTKVSDLDNDAGYLTSFTETDPVFGASAAAGISSADITNWNSKTNNTGTVTSVRVQATAPVQSSVSTTQNTTLNTTISLASGYGDTQNPYASKTAKYVLAAPNAQNGVPTFRALVASDLPSIGNITNGGDITANATIANGDRLIINDESASKVINSSITFGTNTKQYLANNGTWQNAYDDSALAARVTALEELEWATYYSGRSNPSNTQGKNGDIYLQY